MLQIYDRVLGSRSIETLTALYMLMAVLFTFYGLLEFACGLAGLGPPPHFVGGEVIEHCDRARSQRRRELSADVGFKGRSVHRPVDNPGREQAIDRQPGDEGLGVP